MISDTTIAATRTQGCDLKDKFKLNFMIALPAAVCTIILLLIIGKPEAVTEIGTLDYEMIKVFPYIAVLVAAMVVSEIIERLSPNMAPPTQAPIISGS